MLTWLRTLASRLNGWLRSSRLDADCEPAADFLGPMCVGDDRLAAAMCFLGDGAHFVQRHLVLIDEFDDVDFRIREFRNLSARLVWALHAPPVQVRARIRRVLDERAGYVHGRAWNLPSVDPIARRNADV